MLRIQSPLVLFCSWFGMKRVTLLLSFWFFALISASAQVRVWQGTLTLPAYDEGAPDPNPPFDQYATGRFNYPYTLRHNLTDRRRDHAWRALFLENEYLKCSVLPDIGGHLYTCTDKISGKPMFYANPSIKKADIGYRGAWAAFGIEFNFPVSHNWVTDSPVDFSFGQNNDGSASVQVGNVDRVYGMQWTVELVLRPKSTVLEERVTLNNRSDVRHRFYWWNNAGVEVWDDSHIQYPMRFTASHGFTEVDPWPVSADGVDLSIIKNQTKGPVSSFVYGSREPFMGVWNPHTNSGTVHYADYSELPAKKIWSWGVDADGLDWRKALSDNNSAYIEVQAGLFRNQETYAFLEPRQSIHFSEFWMPVREIGGISRANLAGIVNLSRKGDTLQVGLNVNQAVPGATVQILQGDRKTFQVKVDLAPERSWSHEIGTADSQKKYTFELRDSKDAVLLQQTEGEYDWTPVEEIHAGPQSSYRIPASPNRSEDDWVQLGTEQELDGRLLDALHTYHEGLAKFPESFQLNKSAGRLCASLLRFQEAKKYLQPVRSRDTTDPETSYYLGLAYDGLGQVRDAREMYEAAYRDPSFRAEGGLRLAELSAREGNPKQAESYLKDASRAAPDDLRIIEELAAILNTEGKKEESEKLAQQWSRKVPEQYFLLEQLGKPDLQHLSDDAERVLNIAAEYIRLGLYPDALQLLSRDYPPAVADQTEPGVLPPQKHPMVVYFRGYCREKMGQSGSSDFATASKLSTAYVFPSRAEDLTVLRAALRSNPQDATAHYLLGTLYFSRGLTDESLNEWEQARKINGQIPVLHASLGLALLHEKRNPEQAFEVFQEGLHTDPKNVQLYIGADEALSILGRPVGSRVSVLESYPDQANMPSPLVYELILNLVEADEFDKALALFHNRFFPREEGGTNVREVWIETRLLQARLLVKRGQCSDAVSIADHLGDPVSDLAFTHDGLDAFLNSSRVNYLLGEIYRTCKSPDKAQARFQQAATQPQLHDAVWSWLASKELPGFDVERARENLENILTRMRGAGEDDSRSGSWLYNAGILNRALGNNAQAQEEFRDALLSPDQRMIYHLTRLALSESNP